MQLAEPDTSTASQQTDVYPTVPEDQFEKLDSKSPNNLAYRDIGVKTLTSMAVVMAASIVFCGSSALNAAAPIASELAIKGGTLIDGMGGPPIENSVVIIRDNQIVWAGRADRAAIPADAKIIDAKGKWIVPGLWDAQLNYFWFDGELMLNQGVTASIDVGQGEELSLAHRDAVAHGKIRGPRTFTGVGHFQAGAVTGLETSLSMNQAPKTAEQARELARKFLAAGADVIMFHDGNFPPDVVAAGCDEAHKQSKACSLRAGGPQSMPIDAAAAGVDFIPHAQGVSSAIL